MSDIKIRPAGPADISAITRIYADAVEHGTASFELEPPDEAEMARRQQALLTAAIPIWLPSGRALVAGYAYAGPYRARPAYDWTVEDSIYIAPEFHRQGIGRLLLAAAHRGGEARGFRQMIAVIGDSAQAASIAVHAATGFRLIGDAAVRRLQARPLARHRADAARARRGDTTPP